MEQELEQVISKVLTLCQAIANDVAMLKELLHDDEYSDDEDFTDDE